MAISTADAPYPIGLDRFQREVGEWADGVFDKSSKHSVVAHLRREVEELAARAHLGPPWEEAEEAADCFLLLLHFAHKMGFSLIDAATEKFAENRTRKWGAPDTEGVVEHIREETA